MVKPLLRKKGITIIPMQNTSQLRMRDFEANNSIDLAIPDQQVSITESKEHQKRCSFCLLCLGSGLIHSIHICILIQSQRIVIPDGQGGIKKFFEGLQEIEIIFLL